MFKITRECVSLALEFAQTGRHHGASAWCRRVHVADVVEVGEDESLRCPPCDSPCQINQLHGPHTRVQPWLPVPCETGPGQIQYTLTTAHQAHQCFGGRDTLLMSKPTAIISRAFSL